MTARRRVEAAVAAVAATLALSACTAGGMTDATTSVDSYYSQQLAWSGCGTGLDCATVSVPLDWNDPARGSLQLAVARHHATDGKPLGSILMNPGGPGVSGVDFLLNGFARYFGVPLIEQYDLVSWDPRGIGRSTPALQCLSPSDLQAQFADEPSAPRGSAEWLAEVTDQQRRYVDACTANSGGIVPYLDTVQTAHDLDLLRSLLGQQTLDYLGFSYGTLLGATYAGLYPDRVGRMVLDSVVDPAEPVWEQRADQQGGFELALHDFLADCVAGSGCPFTGTVDDALAGVRALLAALDAAPIKAGDGRTLDGGGLAAAIRAALYSPSKWRDLQQAISEAQEGRAGVAYTLIDDAAASLDTEGSTNGYDAQIAYLCNDDGPLSAEDQAKQTARIAEVAPTFAPYLGPVPDICALYPAPSTPPALGTAITADGAPPIVVVGTTGDPATPFAAAQALASELSSGVLVEYRGEGHVSYPGSSGCVDDAVDHFFVSGTVPQDGLVCG